jgi:hypothetical protein
MTHFVGVNDLSEERFAAARRFAHYLGAIVGAGTANVAGPVVHSALPCRRRPDCRPCPGRLLVRRSEAPAQIDWACPACGDEGIIYRWEGSMWDLSPALDPDPAVWTVVLEPGHYRWLLELQGLDIDCQRIVLARRMIDVGVALPAAKEDLDELV